MITAPRKRPRLASQPGGLRIVAPPPDSPVQQVQVLRVAPQRDRVRARPPAHALAAAEQVAGAGRIRGVTGIALDSHATRHPMLGPAHPPAPPPRHLSILAA